MVGCSDPRGWLEKIAARKWFCVALIREQQIDANKFIIFDLIQDLDRQTDRGTGSFGDLHRAIRIPIAGHLGQIQIIRDDDDERRLQFPVTCAWTMIDKRNRPGGDSTIYYEYEQQCGLQFG